MLLHFTRPTVHFTDTRHGRKAEVGERTNQRVRELALQKVPGPDQSGPTERRCDTETRDAAGKAGTDAGAIRYTEQTVSTYVHKM